MNVELQNIDLNNEKIPRVINSAFEIFTKNDYEKASMNNIVKASGVSKGLIYHYFGNKEGLFNFLFDFAMNMSFKGINDSIDWTNTDFFDRYKMMVAAKLGYFKTYPYMLSFFDKYRTHTRTKNIKINFEKEYPGFRDKIYHYNILFDTLREDVDVEKMINVLRWTVKGMMQDFIDSYEVDEFDIKTNHFIEECDEYIDFMKEQFYK
ncbi:MULTISPECIES: TetR/AcrR family transcriptional regulator [unclassified Fusibacter]|uniref:TetR/AcrR family transcriptional regulator n=1 Tax=unclassified Fusibacter TaxID=2624464 RepID=UPI001010A35F|nr:MULTISPECIES: TetR/AcrR family transcriptional regulator [unclassified Fusibacter]MCK8061057.1 TetR/AcrR family transcriptional regulator [Fusibacter sp. A2]NPE20489.1 TetR/AcrR family transcriptional regulator [Fusibacter sp. A1]RXV63689.1 TetR/AcrR family transcriptional regulator [Fusibacter sp. A1]